MDGSNLLLDEIVLRHKAGHWFFTMAGRLADRAGMPVNDYIRYLVIREFDEVYGNENLANKRVSRQSNNPGIPGQQRAK